MRTRRSTRHQRRCSTGVSHHVPGEAAASRVVDQDTGGVAGEIAFLISNELPRTATPLRMKLELLIRCVRSASSPTIAPFGRFVNVLPTTSSVQKL
jgi:hypothetical protein